jgi:hypothetical protein
MWYEEGFCNATDNALGVPTNLKPYYFAVDVNGDTHHQEIKAKSTEMPSTGYICEIEGKII